MAPIYDIWSDVGIVTQKATVGKAARYQLRPIFLISATHFAFFH